MSTLEEQLRHLRGYNDGLLGADPEMQQEIGDTRDIESTASIDAQVDEESIVQRRLRPVLAIANDEPQLAFAEKEDSDTWTRRLTAAKSVLVPAIRAVGRIDLQRFPDPRVTWIGTGWLVAQDIIVTNRHVAEKFVEARTATLTFAPGIGGSIAADIDFRHEFDRPEQRSFRLLEPLHVEPTSGPDMAFFRVARMESSDAGPLASPIPLASKLPAVGPTVAAIGYPASDWRIPDFALMERIYGGRYDHKRLAPGAIKRSDDTRISHDCTTLGGNSGSVLVDLVSGEAVGLHFSGTFLRANYAVPATLVRRRLDQILGVRSPDRVAPLPFVATPPPSIAPIHPVTPPPSVAAPRAHERREAPPPVGGASVAITIPLHITVSLGTPETRAAPRPQRRPALPSWPTDDDTLDANEEARADDYADRAGYQPDFLGKDLVVPLPTVTRRRNDVLTFVGADGRRESELRYEHFSVLMSKSRRLCIFSAVSIDGAHSKKTKRAAWRTDGRIPKGAQILNECYGSPPKFSRGHMTRREDPAWGDAAAVQRGNEDSMHVTNTVPQMQAFNSPIWLELEDYALQNARRDAMQISVFTGPYFDFDGVPDPVIDGVRIPRAFWKVIAFVHEETGELCATGYEMSQERNLPAEEVVFGDMVSSYLNVSTQVPIVRIEERAGLRFGDLAARDPLAAFEETVGDGVPEALQTFSQIRFF